MESRVAFVQAGDFLDVGHVFVDGLRPRGPGEAHPQPPGTIGAVEERLGVGKHGAIFLRPDQAVVRHVASGFVDAARQLRGWVGVHGFREES